ncbi:hypothetical protein [Amycolatopsis sp. NPDC004625]|uniref:hypothetical protein n=1 Tax=Amycolatopsis sp. NPDC004625 TaxID=3154670 RepID=UPI0033B0D056
MVRARRTADDPGGARRTAADPGVRDTGPPSSAAGTGAALRLQRTAGNQAVAALLAGRKAAGPIVAVQRRTAQEIYDSHKDWGGLNLKEEALAAELATLFQGGQYGVVLAVFQLPSFASSDKDDVAQEMVRGLAVLQLIAAARTEPGRQLMSLMAAELAGGWSTADEVDKANVLRAVTGDQAARSIYNRARILKIKQESATDLEALARLFDDDELVDDGTVQSRLTVVLAVTEHLVIPGLQTGIDFSDTGFAGDRTPHGPGFRDPHPSSQNQVGHFLTATGLQYSPAVVSREIPYFGTIRRMVAAPAALSDQDVALRLTIGHEKGPDPDGIAAFVNIVVTGVAERWAAGPEGETEEQRERRITKAIEKEVNRQVGEIIAAFRAQFQACTDADVAAWQDALAALGIGATLNMTAAEVPLGRIAVDPAMRGNSRQDLRLSLVGWRFGQLIQGGGLPDRHTAAGWLRANLGPH